MNFKKLFLTTLTTIMVGGVVLSANQNTSQFEPQAAASLNKLRVYAYLMGDWTDDKMFVSYWGPGFEVSFTNAVEMTQAVNDYYQGLFFYDLPDNTTGLLLRRSSGAFTKTSDQSDDITFSDLFTTDYKLVAVGAWTADGTKRTATLVNGAGMEASKFTGVLTHLDSCSPSQASGYNSYLQIRRLFVVETDGSPIVSASDLKNYSTQTFFDMAYQQTFSISTNRTLSMTVAMKLESLRVSYNAANSTNLADQGGYRDFTFAGTATQAGWVNNSTALKLNYSSATGKYTFSGLVLSAGTFRVIELNNFDTFNVGFPNLTSVPTGFTAGGADNNIDVASGGAGTYNVELSFERVESSTVNRLTFVKIA